MDFQFIDVITRIEGKRRIEARHALSPEAPFLRDHFPRFPVMPGVLVLEALVQAGGWLVRYLTEFAYPYVRLVEAPQIRYSRFVHPGQTLGLCVELDQWASPRAAVRGKAVVEGQTVLAATYTLQAVHVQEVDPRLRQLEPLVVEKHKAQFQELTRGAVIT